MNTINTLLGIPLGYLMYFCQLLVRNYGVSIILFTFLTKLLMFPLSLSSQKNALVMVKIQPALEDIKQRNRGNSALIVEEQRALYR
ncbi:MAG: YidC/Oxa1 family membrane protein insertase, partial [Clostridiaceae bacterium]|nr:YidC/Oxa1 family membrane protein insertase [Clostridiaceae bacterium]